ncbi:MAG: aminopeptidase P family N-terminal domain-containing protein, partial [bacterium]|nr:aminopeptidase P family N-terminal domain-containing protein [bacterium]
MHRLQQRLKTTEAYLITKPEHIFYITDFSGEGFVIVSRDQIILATDQRYWLLAKEVKKRGVHLFDIRSNWPQRLSEQLKKINILFFE